MAAISQTTLSNAFSWIKMTEISLKFVPKRPINNIPALVQMMAWYQQGDKPLSELMMVSLLTHICVTRPQYELTSVQNTWTWYPRPRRGCHEPRMRPIGWSPSVPDKPADILKITTTSPWGQWVNTFNVSSTSPTPTVNWGRVNGVLPAGRYKTQQYATELVIRNIGKQDEGTYKCWGTNRPYGQPAISEEMMIEVVVEGKYHIMVTSRDRDRHSVSNLPHLDCFLSSLFSLTLTNTLKHPNTGFSWGVSTDGLLGSCYTGPMIQKEYYDVIMKELSFDI